MFCWGPAWKWVEGFARVWQLQKFDAQWRSCGTLHFHDNSPHHFGTDDMKEGGKRTSRYKRNDINAFQSHLSYTCACSLWSTSLVLLLALCFLVQASFQLEELVTLDAFFARPNARRNDNDRSGPNTEMQSFPQQVIVGILVPAGQMGQVASSRPNGASCSSGSASGSLPILPGSGGPCHLCQAWVYVHCPNRWHQWCHRCVLMSVMEIAAFQWHLEVQQDKHLQRRGCRKFCWFHSYKITFFIPFFHSLSFLNGLPLDLSAGDRHSHYCRGTIRTPTAKHQRSPTYEAKAGGGTSSSSSLGTESSREVCTSFCRKRHLGEEPESKGQSLINSRGKSKV